MGHRTNPVGMRLGITREWNAVWFAGKKDYASFLKEDFCIRDFFQKKLTNAGVARVVIKRVLLEDKPRVSVYVARPGVVIGKRGSGIEDLLAQLKQAHGISCFLDIVDLRKPDLYAKIVADDIARQLEKRISYKRATKKAIIAVMKAGAKGIRVDCKGRLGGIEIARTEWELEGRLPLHTLRSDIDYGSSEAHTTSGVCGVKVWIYRNDVVEKGGAGAERHLGETSLSRAG